MNASPEHVRVGHEGIPLDEATASVQQYTDAAVNTVSSAPYAFPAYDAFDGGSPDPALLTDADLLAPVLLNVQIKIRTFYSLQRIRPRLQEALHNPVLDQPLAAIDDADELASAVRALYAVLDNDKQDAWGVSGTTLSKVLHRKRPQSVVLRDQWVHACYVGRQGPVPVAKTRSWADYMVLLTKAIRDDIVTQPDAFEALRAAVTPPGELTDVRLLDILAWTPKGGTPDNGVEDAGDDPAPDSSDV